MDDPLKEEMLPEVIEAKPIQEQRFMYQCKLCSGIKFEILMTQKDGVKNMHLICNKGHETLMTQVPEVVNE